RAELPTLPTTRQSPPRGFEYGRQRGKFGFLREDVGSLTRLPYKGLCNEHYGTEERMVNPRLFRPGARSLFDVIGLLVAGVLLLVNSALAQVTFTVNATEDG